MDEGVALGEGAGDLGGKLLLAADIGVKAPLRFEKALARVEQLYLRTAGSIMHRGRCGRTQKCAILVKIRNFGSPKGNAMRVDQAVNIEDLHRMAKRRLPKIAFDFIEGGLEDERGLETNTSAFHKHQLLPRYLVDVSTRDQTK